MRFAEGSTGQVILLKGDHRLRDEEQPFGVAQIVGLVLRDRGMLRETIISAFLMAVLALAPIFFWRLLLDRVLFYESLDTEIVLHGIRRAGRIRDLVRLAPTQTRSPP